jgi:hypothetical protein
MEGEETDREETKTPAAKTPRLLTPTTAKTGGPRDSRTLHETPEDRAARKFDNQKEVISA